MARNGEHLTREADGGPADGIDHLGADGDLDRDLLTMPVIPDLQLERVEELPLKLARKIENVQAYLRQLVNDVSSNLGRLPGRPGQCLQFERDRLFPLRVSAN